MRGICYKAALLRERKVESRDHFIEGKGESLYFIFRLRHGDALMQITRLNLPGGMGQAMDGPEGALR